MPMFVHTVVFDIFGDVKPDAHAAAAATAAAVSAIPPDASSGAAVATAALPPGGGVRSAGVSLACSERLLLNLLKFTLSSELECCTDRATLLRSNSALTQMLSAYAKRADGAAVLRRILAQPLREICESPGLRSANLELQPLKVHQQLLAEFESELGWGAGGSHLSHSALLTDADASLVPEVAAVLEGRAVTLARCCDLILDRILDPVHGVQAIPFGMRWICKTMAELYEARFGSGAVEAGASTEAGAHVTDPTGSTSSSSTDAPCPRSVSPPASSCSLASEIHSMQGGYIFLRFFNPAIVSPSSLGLDPVALPSASPLLSPTRTQQRTLVLIAKVLQNISNGVLFKEAYMQAMNPYILSKRPAMAEFFHRLTQLQPLDDIALRHSDSVDEAASLSSSSSSSSSSSCVPSSCGFVSLPLPHLYSLHALLMHHQSHVCASAASPAPRLDDDPLALILEALGPIPAGRHEHIDIRIRVHDPHHITREAAEAAEKTAAAKAKADAKQGEEADGYTARSSRSMSSFSIVADPAAAAAASTVPLYLQAKSLFVSTISRFRS